jgi:hypothetical protein
MADRDRSAIWLVRAWQGNDDRKIDDRKIRKGFCYPSSIEQPETRILLAIITTEREGCSEIAGFVSCAFLCRFVFLSSIFLSISRSLVVTGETQQASFRSNA